MNLYLSKRKRNQEIVIFCVGNGQVLCDSFAIIVGEFLKARNLPFYIYGNYENNVNSKNLIDYYNCIVSRHNNPFIIVIDSSIDDKIENNGIRVCESIYPAVTNINKNNNFKIGNLSILFKSAKIDGEKIQNVSSVNSLLSASIRVSDILSKCINKNT